MRAVGIFVLVCFVTAATASSRVSEPPFSEVEPPVYKAAGAVNTFGARLAAEYRVHNAKSNYVFSPLSVASAFYLLYQGADGVTRDQLAALFGFDDAEVTHSMRRKPKILSKNADALLANRLYIDDGVTLTRHYRRAVGKENVANVDFAQTEAVRGEINGWVADQTEGLIQEIVSPSMLSASTVFVLANAIYFKGSWKHKFKPKNTVQGIFHGIDGDEVVPIMVQRDIDIYYKDMPELNGILMELPYASRHFMMYIFLPSSYNGWKRFERNYEIYAGSLFDEGFYRYDIDTFMLPRWEFDDEFDDLKDMLSNLGISDAFSGSADFSGIATNTPLSVTDVVHKAKIVVNEKGTEAAASTVAIVARSVGSPPINITVDRPFHYFIVAKDDNTVLFQGAQLKFSNTA